MSMVYESGLFAFITIEGLKDGPQLDVHIDRDAEALGCPSMPSIPRSRPPMGRHWSTVPEPRPHAARDCRAEPGSRATPESLNKLRRQPCGPAGCARSLQRIGWKHGPVQVVRYNGYPSLKLMGDVMHGRSSGDGMKEIERVWRRGCHWASATVDRPVLPREGCRFSAPALLALALLVVFLRSSRSMSWEIPFSVL